MQGHHISVFPTWSISYIILILCDHSVFQVFITNGILSDVVIVVAITDSNARSNAHGITLFLVEEGMPGENVLILW